MLPDVSKCLAWLEKNPFVLKNLQRGLERETLRITPQGDLSQTPFPDNVGSAFTHSWITTDFAEAMLEFITPVKTDIDETLHFLNDLHIYASKNIGDELLWPMSMPCYLSNEDQIILAQYGTSNEAQFKTLYREGLKNRYGAMMQTISGVHYNFSFPLSFWQAKFNINNEEEGKELISSGYLALIRNYYRYGWIIPFLFGASPAVCSSFFKDKSKLEQFNKNKCGCSLPYATSLRLSDIGYTSSAQKSLGITFNQLETYVEGLQKATKQVYPEFSKIGVKVDGHYKQINDHVLQIENEFYAPIRPKRVPLSGEIPTESLLRGGIQYIEVRSLDINPFSPIGVDEDQIRFLDLFLIWCAIADSPEMSASELECAKINWNRIILEGRKPNQIISVGCLDDNQPLAKVGQDLFTDLLRVADALDHENGNQKYRTVCEKLIPMFSDPSLTFSARLAALIEDSSLSELGMKLAKENQHFYQSHDYQYLSEDKFIKERDRSLQKQKEIEHNDTVSFSEYLDEFNRKHSI